MRYFPIPYNNNCETSKEKILWFIQLELKQFPKYFFAISQFRNIGLVIRLIIEGRLGHVDFTHAFNLAIFTLFL